MLLPTDPRAHHSRPPPSPSSPSPPTHSSRQHHVLRKKKKIKYLLQEILRAKTSPTVNTTNTPTTPYRLLRSTSRSFVSSSIIALIVPTYSQVPTLLPHVTDSCHRLRFRARHHQHRWAESLSACLRHTQSPSSCASALRGCL